MTDASYSNGIFAFTNYDDYVYLYDASRRTWTYVYVGDEYDDAITILPNGDFIACQTRCAYFRKLWWSRWGSEWSKKWDVDVGKVVNGPAVYNNSYAYIPDTYGKVLIVNIGSGRPVKLMDMIAVIGRVLDKKPVIEFLPEQIGDVPMTWAAMVWYSKIACKVPWLISGW